MRDEVFRDPAQPFRSCQERVLLAELASEPTFGILVKFGRLKKICEVVGEVLVGQLESGDAIT